MYTHQRYRFKISLTCTLLLVCISWHSELMALELADVPLTKATPESQILSSSKLNEAVTKITGGDYGKIHSLLIIRNNYLVLEYYFAGYRREDLHRIESATKSISSALGSRPSYGSSPSSRRNDLPGCDGASEGTKAHWRR